VKLQSLHARLIAGATFWTLGILVTAFAVGLAIVTRHPRWTPVVHHGMLILGGVVLVTAGVSVIRTGLSPLRVLRERLGAVREGRTGRLEGDYPTEVAPLVADLNALLDERERRVARAAAKAGDLAHGLKTPLAVLANEAARLSAAGQNDLAGTIAEQVTRMQRQVDYHLAQARAVASGPASPTRCDLRPVVDAVVRTLRTLYRERALQIDIGIDPAHRVRCQREDVEEMVGNLLENAWKWASARVVVSSQVEDDALALTVEDDGSGIDAGMREAVLQRGVRADEASPGSGLGLAIVRDLVELYGGSIALDQSPLGGLRITLRLPLPAAATRSGSDPTAGDTSDRRA
jgi:signal transduction histidine kinase